MTPDEALHSATIKPAEFFGLEHEMGQIKRGFLANAVLLSENPMEDITHTRSIEGVINKGRFFSRMQLRQLINDPGN
jgi:imidazolonepropionase-like amidohydrolase